MEERVSLALWRQEEEVAVYILDWESQWRNLFVVNSNKQFWAKRRFIKFPLTSQEIQEKIEEFEELYGK